MKKSNVVKRLLALVAMLSISLGVSGADWPQFQGPDRTGISAETGLAREWPAGGPKVLWTLETGIGYGGAAIRDGKVYFLDRIGSEKDSLRCLDLKTGDKVWDYTYDASGKVSHDGTRNTPTTDETMVYSVGQFGNMVCVNRATGKLVWETNLEKLSGRTRLPQWGVSQSTVLYKNLAIAAAQGPDAGIVALDRATGKVVWKTRPLKGKEGYVSPVLATVDGVDQIVMVSASNNPRRRRGASTPAQSDPGEVVGFAAADGKALWSYEGFQCSIPIPYATPLPDGKFYITGEYGAGSAMIQVKKDGDAFTVKELFATKDIESQIHQPILYKGHLYSDGNGNSRKDGLVCFTLDGKLVWKTKGNENAPTFDRGSVLLADDMLYVVDKDGTLRLIDPTPDGYKELASAKLLEGREIWSPMALSNGLLVLRDHTKIRCIDVRK